MHKGGLLWRCYFHLVHYLHFHYDNFRPFYPTTELGLKLKYLISVGFLAAPQTYLLCASAGAVCALKTGRDIEKHMRSFSRLHFFLKQVHVP